MADIEGAELALLKDPKALARCTQAAIELHEPNITGLPLKPADIAKIFETEHGFKQTAVVGNTYVFRR